MKIQKSKLNKKGLIILSSILVGTPLLMATYIYAFDGNILGWTKSSEHDLLNQIDYGEPTGAQVKEGERINERNKKQSNSGESPNQVGSDRPTDYTLEDNGKSTISVSITSTNISSTALQVRVLISAIVNDGQCTLTLTKGDKLITKTAGVQGLPSSATCKGFDIPLSELSSGAWNIKIEYSNDSLKGDDSKKVDI